jgi:MbtH protein
MRVSHRNDNYQGPRRVVKGVLRSGADSMIEPADIYYVVINHEAQYSIWPTPTPPDGWAVVGPPGTEAECLERIEALWTDMRPRSLREFMDAAPEPAPETSPEFEQGPDLVTRLGREQEVELELFGEPSLAMIRERIEQGVLHLRFPATRGGTLLAVSLDADTRARAGALDLATSLELGGSLVLDFVELRLRARVALDTLRGRGALSPR